MSLISSTCQFFAGYLPNSSWVLDFKYTTLLNNNNNNDDDDDDDDDNNMMMIIMMIILLGRQTNTHM